MSLNRLSALFEDSGLASAHGGTLPPLAPEGLGGDGATSRAAQQHWQDATKFWGLNNGALLLRCAACCGSRVRQRRPSCVLPLPRTPSRRAPRESTPSRCTRRATA